MCNVCYRISLSINVFFLVFVWKLNISKSRNAIKFNNILIKRFVFHQRVNFFYQWLSIHFEYLRFHLYLASSIVSVFSLKKLICIKVLNTKIKIYKKVAIKVVLNSFLAGVPMNENYKMHKLASHRDLMLIKLS